jgi:hypothetical protein
MGHDAIATIGPRTTQRTYGSYSTHRRLFSLDSDIVFVTTILFYLNLKIDGFSYWVVIDSFHGDGWM